jgi:hypothetical protein
MKHIHSMTVTYSIFAVLLFWQTTFSHSVMQHQPGMDRSLGERVWSVQTVTHVPCSDPSLALDSNGTPSISYSASGDLAYATLTATGWVTTIVDGSESFGYTSIALDSSGYPHISYRDYNNDALKYAHWDGTRWIVEFIGSVGESGWYSALALDSNDRPHIAYLGSRQQVKYARWTSKRWEITIVDSIFTSQGLSLALDSGGQPHLSYSGGINKDLKYAHYDGAQWNREIVDQGMIEGASDVGVHSSIALDNVDNPHVSYARYEAFDDFPNDLKYARKQNGTWQIESPDIVGSVGYYTSIALDTRNAPHISYWDQGNQAVKYSYWNGTKWVASVVNSPASLWHYTSLKLDQNDLPHLAYCDTAANELKYASLLLRRVLLPLTMKQAAGANEDAHR